MRLTTLIILIAIVGGGIYYAHTKGYFGQAQQASEQSFDVHFSKGQGLYQASKYQEAIEELQKAIALAPNESRVPDAWLRIAGCYKELKQHDKELETYEKILKEFPDYKSRGLVEKAIEKLKGGLK